MAYYMGSPAKARQHLDLAFSYCKLLEVSDEDLATLTGMGFGLQQVGVCAAMPRPCCMCFGCRASITVRGMLHCVGKLCGLESVIQLLTLIELRLERHCNPGGAVDVNQTCGAIDHITDSHALPHPLCTQFLSLPLGKRGGLASRSVLAEGVCICM